MEIELNQLIDALPGLVWTTTPDGTHEFINQRWRDYAGFDSGSATHDWKAAIHPEDMPEVQRRWGAAIAAGAPGEAEARIRRFDGVYRRFSIKTCPLTDPSGRVVGWCGINTDIEDRRCAEEALLAHESRFKFIFEGLPAMVTLVTPQGAVESGNQYMLDYAGVTLEAVRARPFTLAFHPDDRLAVWTAWQRSVESGTSYEQEARLLRADGGSRWFHTRGYPLRDANGCVSLWYLLQEDIDQRRRAEAQLAGEKQILEQIARGLPLTTVLESLSRLVEDLLSGSCCSILLVAQGGDRFRVAAAPTLAGSVKASLEAQVIVSDRDPCSLAVTSKGPVMSTDPVHASRWDATPWFTPVSESGFRACWAMPILSEPGEASGAFVVFRRDGVEPTSDQRELIDRFAKIAGIAIKRAHGDEALRAREAELRQAHGHLTQAQRLSHTGSFTTDVYADDHVWSDELYRILDFVPGTKVGIQSFRALIDADDLPAFDAGFRRTLGDGTEFDQTFRIVTPKGVAKHLHAVAHHAEAVKGRRIVAGSIQDVTASRNAEDALRASESELRRAYSYLSEAQRLSKTGSFTWDVFADEHNWSEEIRRIFGFALDVQVTMGMIQAAVHPEDMAEVASVIGGAAQGRDFDLVFRILTTLGEVRHAHVVGHRIQDIVDRTVFLGALQDVTASREAEADLRRANSYLTIAQRLSKTGSFTWDVQTDESRWSEEMYRIFEIEKEGQAPLAFDRSGVHPDDWTVVDGVLSRALAGHDFDVEFRLLTASGMLKHVHVVGNLLEEAAGRPVFIGAVQDVTDRKVAEEGLDRARSELTHVARATALSALTASIAHEVNQPLAGIITNASACLRLLAADPPDTLSAQATAQRTIRDANRASEVIKRLRALFARKPMGREPVDLNDATREVLALSSGELQGRGVVVQTDFAVPLPRVPGDRVQLQQVILNLVLNAAEAVQARMMRPREIRISTVATDDVQVLLAVRDSGVGVADEHLEQMFNPFYTTKPEGMGVGLSISRSIIEAHGGRIWASANKGAGLTVSMTLPLSGSDISR